MLGVQWRSSWRVLNSAVGRRGMYGWFLISVDDFQVNSLLEWHFQRVVNERDEYIRVGDGGWKRWHGVSWCSLVLCC